MIMTGIGSGHWNDSRSFPVHPAALGATAAGICFVFSSTARANDAVPPSEWPVRKDSLLVDAPFFCHKGRDSSKSFDSRDVQLQMIGIDDHKSGAGRCSRKACETLGRPATLPSRSVDHQKRVCECGIVVRGRPNHIPNAGLGNFSIRCPWRTWT